MSNVGFEPRRSYLQWILTPPPEPLGQVHNRFVQALPDNHRADSMPDQPAATFPAVLREERRKAYADGSTNSKARVFLSFKVKVHGTQM
jgi:hypothetical protein